MGLCFAPDCNHTSTHGCKMIRFPSDLKLKAKWEKLIRTEKKANKFSLICSCHFEDGDRTNLPTIFNYNKDKRFNFPETDGKRRLCKKLSREPVVEIIKLDQSSTSAEVSRPESALSDNYCTTAADTSRPSSQLSNFSTSSQSSLEAENYFLKKDIDSLQTKLKSLMSSFSFEQIENDDHLVAVYTGLPDKKLFYCLYNYLIKFEFNYYSGWNVQAISQKKQLFMTLIKLKLNLINDDIAVRFNCSRATVSNIVITWIMLIHEVIFKSILTKNVPSTNKNKTCLPSSFAQFTNCKMIIDCTEVYTATPEKLDLQKQTYSSYKSRNTLKGLIGVSPNGVITFISDLYVGNTSDKKIVQHCGILNLFKPGDLILADKGFLIQDILPAGVSLNIPPFLMRPQFTQHEILQTKSIAKARIHVERAIQRIKLYKILNFIPSTLRPYSSMVFQVCGALTLFNYPLIKEVTELYRLE